MSSIAASLASDSAFVDRATEQLSVAEEATAVVTHRELLKNLVMRDLKLKYRGSVLGFAWSLANPLAMVIIYTLAFKYILGSTQPGYPFFVLLGVLAWTFFANSATMSTGAILESGGLIRSVRFPRAILPLATVCFNLAQYVLTVLVFVPVMLTILGVPPAWPMLLFPAVVILQAMFTFGVALMLSAATTHFRDVRHLVDVILPLCFWTTPIVYAIHQVPAVAVIGGAAVPLRTLIRLSPMSPFIVAYQRIFYEQTWPDPGSWGLAVAYAAGMLALGVYLFRRLETELLEHL
ncbi:MAG: ABC transporter permease [Acidobacteria bacterium]|nr:ABC transporter permease [Acidobacteriota bacterium]